MNITPTVAPTNRTLTVVSWKRVTCRGSQNHDINWRLLEIWHLIVGHMNYNTNSDFKMEADFRSTYDTTSDLTETVHIS